MNLPVSSQPAQPEGFSLVEVLIAITVIGALLAIALPSFNSYKEQQKISVAVADLRVLDNRIKSYKLNNEKFPAALSDLPQLSPPDPWGRSYNYLNIEEAKKLQTPVREDRYQISPSPGQRPMRSAFPSPSKSPASTLLA